MNLEYVVAIIVSIIIIGAIFKPRRCSVCNTPFKRKYYTWKIDGKKQHLCPNCNRQMERKQSKIAFNKKY